MFRKLLDYFYLFPTINRKKLNEDRKNRARNQRWVDLLNPNPVSLLPQHHNSLWVMEEF